MLTTIRRTAVAAVVTAASVAAIAAPASAAGIHYQIDPVYSVTPCPVDTSPNYPACGTTPMVAIQLPAPRYAIAPCRHDPSLTPEQCYPNPR